MMLAMTTAPAPAGQADNIQSRQPISTVRLVASAPRSAKP